MKINDSKLYGRVILGYIIVFFIIACMSLIFIYQKIKLEDINNKQYQINLVHSKISVLPLYVNKLSSLSESVFTWNYRDYLEYQRNRLFTDSILQDIKIHCNGFIQIEQVDSLCNMLEQKEYSLLHIMRTIKSKEKSDSLFFESQIPKKSLKTRTVTRKKKGLAGFFGKTETVQEPYYVIEYSELKKKTNIDHKNYLIQIEMESDSLIMKNKLINNQLNELLYVLDDDIQKKYRNDINEKLQKQKQLEYQKENLLKKKKSLGLKIDNYSKIMKKEIPRCERNKTAPNMPVIKTENSKMDVKWYIAAVIAVVEIISGFMPWVSLYYADLFQGQTISCAGIFDLLNDISKFEDWTNSTPEVLGVFVFIIMFGFVMLFINGYFIAQVLQKRESEVSGTIAGISGIVVSVAILLYKWYLDISMEEDGWRWISINTQVGVWLMLLAGIALICVIVFYKSDTEAETKNKSNLEFEVMNYDPVLPIRMKTLKIRKENDKLILELTYAEFEWASIEEFIVDIQLVRYDGTVNILARNALFEKKGQNFARFQLQDAGYDLDGIASARINILAYNIYKSQKKHEEKGSGFSAYSDYSVDELRSARFASPNMVMCMEKNIGENHQCCCGQVYSNKNNKCPLCGKERRGK